MRARYFKFGGKLVYKAWWHISSVFCDVFGRIELCGYENVPKSPCIIVANHVSYLDPMAMAFFHETELCAVARDTLMRGRILGWVFRRLNAIPVKRGQSGNLGAFRDVLAPGEERNRRYNLSGGHARKRRGASAGQAGRGCWR